MNRKISIDVFRGITIAFMILVNSPGSWSYVFSPLRHAEWHGCTPTDLVFPFFIVAIGLSMAYSFRKYESDSKSSLLLKVLKRSALIFLVGFLLNWFPFYTKSILDVRVFGVLQRIAMAYLIAGSISVFIQKDRTIIVTIVILLALYSFVQKFSGDFSLEGNINNYLDKFIIPEKNLYGGYGIKFDPEGWFGSLSTAAQILIGFALGRFLQSLKDNQIGFILFGIIFGIILLFFGWVRDHFIPINKPLWTISYVVYSSGWALISFSMIVLLVEILKWKKWAFPFIVFGMNSLFSFVLSGVIIKLFIYVLKGKDGNAYGWLYSNVFQSLFGNYWGSFTFALFICTLVYAFAWILYRNKIWIKL